MKKIAILILSILIAGLFVACNQEVTIDAQTYANMEVGTFVLNGQNYATLQAAIDALSGKAIGNEPGVIYLTKDASGPGAVIDGIEGVKIDFGEYTYSFTNVTATQGSTDGNFGLAIKGGSSVTLAGTKAMNLFDNTTGLTMVYVEGATTSLAVEQAPQMTVADDQFVFWAANGATLTIAGATKVNGGVAATATDTTDAPTVKIEGESRIAISTLKVEKAAVVFNSSYTETAATVGKITGDAAAQVVVTKGNVTITTKDETAPTVSNTGSGTVTEAGQTVSPDSDSVALIGVTKYTDVNDAVAAAENGQTITILKTITSLDLAMTNNEFFVDLNGKNIESLDWDDITAGKGKMTILGEGVLTITSTTPPAVGHLILRGGTYSCEVDPYADKGFDAIELAGGGEYKIRKMPEEVRYTSGDETVTVSLNRFAKIVNSGVPFSGITVTQLADVDLTGIVWTPIGNGYRDGAGITGNVFKGSFNGNGKSINGLSDAGYTPKNYKETTDGKEYCYGLFGCVEDATITGVVLNDVSIASGKSGYVADNVGGIAGYSRGSLTVSECTVNGAISGGSVGGVVGRAYGYKANSVITISKCVNNASLTGIAGTIGVNSYTDRVGGIAGYINGVTGYAGHSASSIPVFVDSCENNGSLKTVGDKGIIGGIAVYGFNSNTVDSYKITNNSSKGSIEQTTGYWAATVACECNEGFDKDADFVSSAGNIVAATATVTIAGSVRPDIPAFTIRQTNISSTYTGLDFNDTTVFEKGTGAEGTPYLIGTKAELKYLRFFVNSGWNTSEKYYQLTGDIDLSGEIWTPIGTPSNPFKGRFDGQNLTVSGLRYYNSGNDYFGLFGVIGGAATTTTIANLVLKDINYTTTTGVKNVGGLFAGNLSAVAGTVGDEINEIISISNVSVSGSIEVHNAGGATIGGVGGKVYTQGQLIVTNCTSSVNITCVDSITGDIKAAGIVGFVSNRSNSNAGIILVDSCKNYGDMNLETSSGVYSSGIINKAWSTVYVKDCSTQGKFDITSTNESSELFLKRAFFSVIGRLQNYNTSVEGTAEYEGITYNKYGDNSESFIYSYGNTISSEPGYNSFKATITDYNDSEILTRVIDSSYEGLDLFKLYNNKYNNPSVQQPE